MGAGAGDVTFQVWRQCVGTTGALGVIWFWNGFGLGPMIFGRWSKILALSGDENVPMLDPNPGQGHVLVGTSHMH